MSCYILIVHLELILPELILLSLQFLPTHSWWFFMDHLSRCLGLGLNSLTARVCVLALRPFLDILENLPLDLHLVIDCLNFSDTPLI